MIQKVSCFLLILTCVLGFKCIIGFLAGIVKVCGKKRMSSRLLPGYSIEAIKISIIRIEDMRVLLLHRGKNERVAEI